MLKIDTHAHYLPRDWPDLATKYGQREQERDGGLVGHPDVVHAYGPQVARAPGSDGLVSLGRRDRVVLF